MQDILLGQIKYKLEDIEKLLKWRLADLENTIRRLRKHNKELQADLETLRARKVLEPDEYIEPYWC